MKMDRLPLLFTFKDLVYGDGFLADILRHKVGHYSSAVPKKKGRFG